MSLQLPQASAILFQLMNRIISNLQLFSLLTFLSVLIMVFDNFHFFDFAKRFASFVTNPISFGIYKTYQDISRQFYFVYAARFAAQENKALKEQIAELISENAKSRKTLAELQTQISQEKSLDPNTYNLIPARPIGLSRYLKIDKGSDSGIKEGAAVVYKDNFVGKVIQVSPASSNVQLLEDPESKISAFSQGLGGRARGILLGQFGNDLLLDKILHEEKIAIGDLVYSEGLEGFLPRGLVLGKVVSINERENELFKQAKVREVFDIKDLELVFVIKD